MMRSKENVTATIKPTAFEPALLIPILPDKHKHFCAGVSGDKTKCEAVVCFVAKIAYHRVF
jgi:hypothetical protein